MARHILTGAPGSGKTALLRLLERAGYAVVEEAATDVIALEHALGEPQPWEPPGFLDLITALQRQRERAAPSGALPVFFDRSPVCTLALARFLGREVTPLLAPELDRIKRDEVYERSVFFVRNLGFVEPTAARRISYAESLMFEKVHEQAYRELGFNLVDVPAGPLTARAALIRRWVGPPAPGGCSAS